MANRDLELPAGITRLVTAIEGRVPGVLNTIVRATLFDTIEDFCARSGYWSAEVTWTDGDISDATITVPPPDGAVIDRIVDVWGLGAVDISQPDMITALDGDPQIGRATVVLRPASLTDTPEFLTSTWFAALYEGTCARLYFEPSKPYTNVDAGKFYSERYETYLGLADSRAGRRGVAEGLQSDTIDRLYATVRDTAGDEVSQAELQRAAWRAIEEFYLQSTWMRAQIYWRMASGVSTIELDPHDDYRKTAWVLGCTGLVHGRVQPPATLRDLTWPAPATERGGQAWLALKPHSFNAVVSGCEHFPELWSTWFETIVSGTLFRLLAAPRKPWTEPKLAGFHGGNFRRGVQTARSEAARGFHQGAPTPFPYFARGRSRGGISISGG